jgi:hypothetical protein
MFDFYYGQAMIDLAKKLPYTSIFKSLAKQLKIHIILVK